MENVNYCVVDEDGENHYFATREEADSFMDGKDDCELYGFEDGELVCID